jgi:hypothetical protein
MSEPIIAPEYVTETDAATLSGFSRKALETLRYRGDGPKYYRVGRCIRYRTDQLRAWIEGGQ